MSCNCTKIKDLPTCINELIIGTITPISQDVYVFFKNTTLNQTTRLTGDSDEDGLVTVDLTDLPENFFSENYNYEIYVTTLSASPSDKQTITVGAESDTCLMVKFFKVEDGAIESVYYSTIVAQLK